MPMSMFIKVVLYKWGVIIVHLTHELSNGVFFSQKENQLNHLSFHSFVNHFQFLFV